MSALHRRPHTNCTTIGDNTHCVSTSTDNSAQQQQAYEAGQKIGNALGTGFSTAMQAHSFDKGLRKYCDAHPGEEWTYRSRLDGHTLSSGHCPSDSDISLQAANAFMSRHRDYIKSETNSQLMVAYLAWLQLLIDRMSATGTGYSKGHDQDADRTSQ